MFRSQCLVLILVLSTSLARAGIVFEVETKHHDARGDWSELSEVWAEGKLLKTKVTDGPQKNREEMIFRGDRGAMVNVDHSTRSYTVIDQQFLKKMGGQIAQAAGQMEAALRDVPPEQRAMVEQMMKQRGQTAGPTSRTAPEVRSTDQRETVYGYPAVLYEVRRDGRKVSELWVTDWKNIEGSRDVAEGFLAMGEFMKSLVEAMPKGMGSGELTNNPMQWIKQLNGFPVAVRNFADDGTTIESESALRSAVQRRFAPADFDPPATYSRQQMPGQ